MRVLQYIIIDLMKRKKISKKIITDKAVISALRWVLFFSEVDWYLFIHEINTIVILLRITCKTQVYHFCT